jgi:hypothetical protein
VELELGKETATGGIKQWFSAWRTRRQYQNEMDWMNLEPALIVIPEKVLACQKQAQLGHVQVRATIIIGNTYIVLKKKN